MKLSSLIPTTRKNLLRLALILVSGYVIIVGVVCLRQRSLLYFPSHETPFTSMTPWLDGSRVIGYSREVSTPRTIWLMLHGNGGQAADRDYVLPHLSDKDSLYVLEYPGFGSREGSPTIESMNEAASEAYQLLRSRNPNTPVCLLGESIGSGPACFLAGEKRPPDKIVLVVPFDTLASVAAQHCPFVPVRLLLHDNWDNGKALSHYGGPVDIFGAREDRIIPIEHARALAKVVPNVRFVEISGGHNGWSYHDEVKISR